MQFAAAQHWLTAWHSSSTALAVQTWKACTHLCMLQAWIAQQDSHHQTAICTQLLLPRMAGPHTGHCMRASPCLPNLLLSGYQA